jgi:hypothetical protein
VRTPDEAGGDRYVACCSGGDFESWWSVTGVRHGTWRRSDAHGSIPSAGTSVGIPSLLFPQAEMHSTIYDFVSTRADHDQLNGRPVQKLTGSSKGHFGAGRPVTVWVDPTTHLIARVVVETPESATRGSVDRVTIVYRPQANPTLPTASSRSCLPKSEAVRAGRLTPMCA